MSFRLAPDHAEALRAVDLRFAFITHGGNVVLDGYGPACLGIDDSPYKTIASLVEPLDPSQGDSVAAEGISPYSITPYKIASSIISIANHSPYIPDQNIPKAIDSITSPPGDDAITLTRFLHINRLHFGTLLEQARSFRIVDPSGYGQGLALIKNLKVGGADVTKEEYDEWFAVLREVRRSESWIGHLSLPDALLDLDIRNKIILQRLGKFATTMDTTKGQRKPILLYVAGVGHRSGMRRILRQNDIPSKVATDTPKAHIRERVLDIKRYGDPRRYTAQWINNAEKLHKRK